MTSEGEDSSATGLNGPENDDGRPESGAAYLFVRDGSGGWSQEVYVKAENADANDRFGRSAAALSRTTLVVAAPFEDSSASGINGDSSDNTVSASGAVYLFE